MILRLEDVNKNYEKCRIRIKIIKHISYEFKSGNIYTITGPKYTGKTVLLNLIGNLEYPTSGYLTIDNISYIYKDNKNSSKIKREYFGYVLPYLDLNPNKSIYDNITEPLYKCKNKEERYNNVLKQVGLNNKRILDINNLSDFDRIRLLIARSLINNPKIILIDEMLENLNTINKNKIMKYLKQIASNDKIIIISSNSKQIIDNSDKIINLIAGRIK